MIKKVSTIVRNHYSMLLYKVLGRIAPHKLVSMHYRKVYGKPLNWDNPRNIDEKINWLKFHSDTTLWVRLADKFAVRQYVEEKGLGYMLVKLYGKWDSVDAIDWSSLPEQFVMKTNNGSGDAIICKNKKTCDIAYYNKYFSRLLNVDFGLNLGEPHYNKIQPCIIVEELLDATLQPVASSSLVDYKIWTFDGNPTYIWACYNRTKHSTTVGLYDLDWNFHPEFSVSNEHYVLADHPIPCPKHLDEMLYAASVLCKGFSVVRFDCYEVADKVFFGEMTFTPAAGFNYFYTDDFLNILGDFCKLPENLDA